jgi:RHS repeat-associated protein
MPTCRPPGEHRFWYDNTTVTTTSAISTVKNSGGTVLEYMKYMANAGRGTAGTSGCSYTTTQTYYSMDWQVLQKVDTLTPPPPCQSGVTTSTYVWSLSYIDDLVAKDCDNPSGRTYVQQDANHNVTALVNTSGTVMQRMIYDPYGVATVLTSAWGSSGNSMFEYGHQGGRYDSISGLYNFRMRDYSPTLGRWMQQDPMGYVDGMNLYQYEVSNPIRFTDAMGTTHQLPEDPDEINPVLNDMWAEWAACQKQKIGNALANLYPGNKDAASQGDAIADAVVNAVMDWRRTTGHNLFPDQATPKWYQDLWPGESTLGCGGWQDLTSHAALAANAALKKSDAPCLFFRVDLVEAFYGGASTRKDHLTQHNWIEICRRSSKPGTPGAYVVIDPWPTGGVQIMDSSNTAGWTSVSRFPGD